MRKKRRLGLKQATLLSVLAEIVLAGILLLVFAYFHHVMPRKIEDEGGVVARPTRSSQSAVIEVRTTPTPAPTQDVSESATPVPQESKKPYTPDMDEVGSFALKYADKFTSGEIISGGEDGDWYYRSPNLNITLTVRRVDSKGTSGTHTNTCYVADFYIRDISCFSNGFAHGSFGKGEYEWLRDIASGSVLAVNGDFASMRNYGVVIRDGHVYRTSHSTFDACALYWDGTMVTYAADEWTGEKLVKNGAYQAWSFGPELLDDEGRPLKSFNTTNAVKKTNPRTAIGYFEPGHYCFVVVDGRTKHSPGMTMEALAKFMSDLGCKQAYNLDGGESSSMYWMGGIVSEPSDGGRKISDAIMLIEPGEAIQ